jgi:ribosomal protein L40E
MTKETVGYVRLEWTCPSCGSRNPGPQKTCGSCGAAQPEDVEFEQAAQEELIKDEAEIARAKAGPDVHCGYCGARNPAGAESCTQCGADLREGVARARGRVVGAHRRGAAKDVACPSCGAQNPATALECAECGAPMGRAEPATVTRRRTAAKAGLRGCSPVAWVILGGVIVVGAILLILSLRTKETAARVQDLSWTRSIAIEGLVPVTYEDWRDEIPSGAVMGTCTQKVHHTQAEPAPNADKVCGTPYTVDTGSGYGEVVQDCEYQVYADWCKYEVEEWRAVDTVTLEGEGFGARWPVTQLQAGQREGEREETYKVVFDADGKMYTYTVKDEAEFARFEIGSRWNLKVNTFNAVVSVEPVE